MITIQIARHDYGLSVSGRGKRYLEKLEVTVHGKNYDEWISVPFRKDDPNPAERRLRAFRRAWLGLMARIMVETFEVRR